jgi:hypothetical protein
MMLYNKYVTPTNETKTCTGRGSEEEPDRNPFTGRGAGSTSAHRGSGESIRGLFCSGRHQADYREETEEINRMERDRKLLEQRPAPDQRINGGCNG